MCCSSVDLKAYALGEMEGRGNTSVEEHIQEHIRACDGCREELERLDLTRTVLIGLSDEEIPQRIAFVSDAVFEPRWWQRIWRSGPAMGFASAVVLAAAIFAHGAMRPPVIGAPTPVNVVANLPTDQKQIDDRVQVAVAKAVSQTLAQSEQRQAWQNLKLLEAAEKRLELRYRTQLVSAQETIRMYQQQAGRMLVAYNNSQSAPQQ